MVNDVRDVGVVLEALTRQGDNTEVNRGGPLGVHVRMLAEGAQGKEGDWTQGRMHMQCWKVYLLLMTLEE